MQAMSESAISWTALAAPLHAANACRGPSRPRALSSASCSTFILRAMRTRSRRGRCARGSSLSLALPDPVQGLERFRLERWVRSAAGEGDAS